MDNEKIFPIPKIKNKIFSKEKKDFSNWLKKINRKYPRKVNMPIVKDAFNLSLFAHRGQKRENGDNYISHPLAVAKIMTEEVYVDNETVCAALLHDVLEDTEITRSQINAYFGESISILVNNVTKMKNIINESSTLREENLKKIFLLTFSDPRTLMIKVSDRIHNLSTLDGIKEPKRIERIVRESSNFYSPLSSRFGLNNLKQSLDDQIFKILNQEEYAETYKTIKNIAPRKKRALSIVSKKIQNKIKKDFPKCEFKIKNRKKSIHSIWRKKIEQNLNFEEIRDIYAIRIIAKTRNDCYKILGSVHSQYEPMQGFFHDYIAAPKNNGYQSIHTVITTKIMPFVEVQIRTAEMNEICEWGEAAHWIYKKDTMNPSIEKNLKKMQKARVNFKFGVKKEETKGFIDELKNNFFQERIFVYTPKGDKISLPKNATALDFAFAVHSELGSKTKKIKINGKIEKLHKKLKIGDEVEIIKNSKTSIKPNWIFKTITSQAKREIKNHLRKINRTRIEKSGKIKLNEIIKEKGLYHLHLTNTQNLKDSKIFNDLLIQDKNDLFYRIGVEALDLELLLEQLLVEKQEKIKKGKIPTRKKNPSLNESRFIFKKIKYKKISICKKTRPIPGDNIVGILENENLIIKRKMNEKSKKHLEVRWNTREKNIYQSEIILTLLNRKGSLFEVLETLKKLNINILNSVTEVKPIKPEVGYVKCMIEIENLSILNNVLKSLKKVDCVIEARRSVT
tara:strand:+ start:4563 stop:6770 length:2208 start_codon:yes stop_codon:yes gene_type:complete